MQLNERLEICLLALASRHPRHVVDINEDVLGTQPLGAAGWNAHDIIELLRLTHPALLYIEADLVINTQECAIYLHTYATQTPALHVHCRGKLPALQGNVTTRKQALKQLQTVRA
jgi:hypothetical protein